MGTRVIVVACALFASAGIARAHSPRWPISSEVSRECALPADQAGSFMVPALTLPISVWIDPSFNASQRELVRQSIAEWNRYGERLQGRTLFTIDSTRRVDSQALKKWKTARIYCRSPETADGSGLTILRETSTQHWLKDLGLSDSIPAVTMRCAYGDGKAAQSQQWILVQTELPKSQAPFKVWMIHELGHVVGLDHTCDSTSGPDKAAPGWRSCVGLRTTDPYRQAVLYPYSPTGDQPFEIDLKERLGANDELRAACLLRSLARVRFQ